jgi:hypothetical protein
MAIGSSVGAKGLMSTARSSIKQIGYKRGAAVAAGVVGAGAIMRRRKSGLDKTSGRPTGIRNY